MDTQSNKPKRTISLNVVSNKPHKGFGAGAIDLNNVSSVIIDGDEAYLDIGAIHGKSKVERRIRFVTNRDEVPNGRQCWVVWVAVDRLEEGPYYAGVTACEMLIDAEEKRGWKILPDHVNKLDHALKRRINVEELSVKEKGLLRNLLIEHNPDWWERSTDELKEALATEESN